MSGRTRFRLEEVEVVRIELKPWVEGLGKPHWDARGPYSHNCWSVDEEHLVAVAAEFDVMLCWHDQGSCVVGYYNTRGNGFQKVE